MTDHVVLVGVLSKDGSHLSCKHPDRFESLRKVNLISADAMHAEDISVTLLSLTYYLCLQHLFHTTNIRIMTVKIGINGVCQNSLNLTRLHAEESGKPKRGCYNIS